MEQRWMSYPEVLLRQYYRRYRECNFPEVNIDASIRTIIDFFPNMPENDKKVLKQLSIEQDIKDGKVRGIEIPRLNIK